MRLIQLVREWEHNAGSTALSCFAKESYVSRMVENFSVKLTLTK